MNIHPIRFVVIAIILLAGAFCPLRLPAQTPAYQAKNQALHDTIARMDSLCFEAFNRQDVEALKKVFSDKVEFNNDGGGVTTYAQTMANFQAMFERNKSSGLRRELVPNSLEVYPLKDYGAIEVGMHRFIHTENGKEEIATLKFVQVWQLEKSEWKITRVISYGH